MHTTRTVAAATAMTSIALATLVGCGDDPKDPSGSDTPGAAVVKPAPAEGTITQGHVSIGEDELFIECEGSGTPVVVFETVSSGGRFSFYDVQQKLIGTTTVCTYDRAGHGQSAGAPTHPTGQGVVEDAHTLLEAAGVPAPYILVGSSAGADYSVHHARAHPDDVVGVVAWNPVLLDPGWGPRLKAQVSPEEWEFMDSFLAGEDFEKFDWYTTAEEMAALPTPDDVPLVLMHSDATQCEGIPGCDERYPAYTDLGEEYVADWPGATYRTVSLRHMLDEEDPELIAGLVLDLVEASRAAN
jgi:pimeloyl-ACP methyl ester carboxylesterase